MRRHAVATAHALFALLLGAANVLAQPPQYTVQDLGTSTSSLTITVTGINRNGEVVGSAGGTAFRTQPNAPINLPADYIGTLGGSGNCGSSPCESVATGINSSGQVVGYSTTSSGEIHGFRTAANASINPATDDMGSLGGQPDKNNVLTKALGINDAGQVVGVSQASDGTHEAFRTAPNAAINPATDNIEPPPTNGTVYNSEGRSINTSGDVLGDYFTSAFLYSALFFHYHDGTVVTGGGIDAETGVTNINDSDQVVSNEANQLGGAGVQLGTCPNVQDCFVRSLNNSFQTVGFLHSPSSSDRAFLFMGGTVYDLNTLIPTNSGWVLTRAGAINDNGQIIAEATLNGVNHVVRLDPSKPAFTYSIAAASSSISVPQGGSATDNITLTLTSGTPGPVSFSTSPLPNNLTVTFSATACTPTCTSTMTVSVPADAYTGTEKFMVFANSPGFSANMLVNVTITTPSGGPGFSWSLSGETYLSVNQGNPVSDLLTATLKSGTPDVITFRTTGSLPPGVNVTFSPASCTPNCTTTMTISTSYPTTPPGTYFIEVSGTCGCSAGGTVIHLQVNAGGDTTTGLVGWWKLNDGSGNTAADSSGSGNNATLYNPSWWTSNYGVTNLFNGSTSYGFVSESSSLEMTNQLTVAFWVRPTNNSSSDQRILNKIYDWDVKLSPQNDPQFDALGHYLQLNHALPANTWNHVAFTFNNGTVTGYVNGQAQSTVANTFTGSGSLLTWAYGLYLGSYDSTPSNAFAGSLNDLRIYNRALTAADVATVYAYLAGSTFTFSMSAANSALTVTQGAFVTDTITATTLTSGTSTNVTFDASGLPTGATAQFTYSYCTPTCTTTLSITTSSSTPTGTYNVVVNGTAGGTSANTTVALTVTAPASFSLTPASSTLSVTAGGSVTDNITANPSSGTQSPVTFTASGLPSGATGTFSPGTCTPACTTTLTIATASTTPAGTYQVAITGQGGGSQTATGVTLTVNSGGGGGDITTGLMAWWKLNDGSGSTAADSSGNGNNATLYNPSWTTSTYGPTNFFTGSGSYGLVNESASLEMTTQLTVAFWLNPSSNPDSAPRIVSKLYDWDVKLNTTTALYPQFTAGNAYAELNAGLPLNTWSHVAFTYNNGTVAGYVNGTPVSFMANTFTGSGSLPTYAYNLYLGVRDGSSNPYIGDLNDVRVYNRALSAAEIKSVYDYLAGSSSFSFSLSAAMSSLTVRQGSVTDTITATLNSGTPTAVSFSASGIPSGVTVQFSPTTCSPTCATTMTIDVPSNTPPGTYNILVTATGGGASANTTIALTVLAPANYSIGVASSSLSVTQGGSVSDRVTLTALSGTQSSVQLSTSGLPAGATGMFTVGSCTPTCSSTLTISTASTTPAGTYQVGITGNGGGSQADTGVTLTVNAGSAGPDITSGLAMWLKFNDGGGTAVADYSGNGNNATLYNPSWTTSTYGPTNFFTGSGSYGLVNESASLEMTNQLTVAFWVNPSANPETAPRIISKLYDWDVKLNSTTALYPQFTAGSAYAELSTAVPLNTWSHVAFTFNNGTVTGYVNGAPVSFIANTFTGSGSLPGYAYNLYLGVRDGSSNPYIGDLNDVRVYNRALTGQDVAALYSYLGGSTPFTFTITPASSSISVTQGGSSTDTISARVTSGQASAITFGTSSLPSGVTATFSPASCTPECSTTMTIAAASTATAGTYTIGLTASGGNTLVSTSATLTVNAASGGADITTGLMGWWKLNEGSGSTAADSSRNGNNATLYNPSWTTSTYGPTNFFTGSGSYGLVNESASLEMTNQLTVAFWVNPSANPETAPRIISKLYDWDVKLNSTTALYPQFTAGSAYAELSTAVPLSTWTHVVFTFNNGTVTGYVNGVPVSFMANTFTGSGSLPSYAYNLYLGVRDGSSNPYIGDLNDVRVYNRALTGQDVAALYAYLPANH